MSAVEIANTLQGQCTFNAADPPAIIRADGFTTVARTGVGLYTLELDARYPLFSEGNPPTDLDWFIAPNIFPTGNPAFSVKARVNNLNGRQVLVELYTAAGVLTDGGIVSVAVFRLPTIE